MASTAEHTVIVIEVDGAPAHPLGTRSGLQAVLAEALRAAGVPVEASRCGDAGPGVAVLVAPHHPKAPLLEALPAVLAEAVRRHNASARLRLAVHTGSSASATITAAARLLDSAPVRQALAGSPGVLAIAVSQTVFEEVVCGSALDPAAFRPVPIDAPTGGEIGWITLPDPPVEQGPLLAAPLRSGNATLLRHSGTRAHRAQQHIPVPRPRTGRAAVAALDNLMAAALAPLPPGGPDPLDDPAPQVRAAAVAGGIHQFDGPRWLRVLGDPSPQVRAATAVRGDLAPSFVWHWLTLDPDAGVRAAVAGSPWAPAAVQRRLLSDPHPGVVAAATRAEPLARLVRVRPTLPATREIVLPLSQTQDQRIRLLDRTAVTLTQVQLDQLAAAVHADHPARTAARARVIAQLGSSGQAHWLARRWKRWRSVFAPVRPGGDSAAGLFALFDAVLGMAAAPGALPELTGTRAGAPDPADLRLLTLPWSQVLLPTAVTEDTVYGPRTPVARRLLSAATRLPRNRRDALLMTRIGIDHPRWSTARKEAIAQVAGEHRFAARFLVQDCLTIAELTADQRPTDPMLAEALWGAAVVTLHPDRLSPATAEVLARPAAAAGLLDPNP